MVADPADEEGYLEDHILGVGFLTDGSIDLQPKVNVLRIRYLVLRDEGADGTGRVKALGVAPRQAGRLCPVLGGAVGHVERQGVAADVVHGVRFRNVDRSSANDDTELHFVMQLGRSPWQL